MVLVSAWKTMDIEVEVDVSIDEVLAELNQLAEEGTGEYYRRAGAVMDACTRILAKIGDDVIAKLPDSAKATMRERLGKELVRYGQEVRDV